MKIVYVADDGTEFSSKEECSNYEAQRKETFGNVPIMFDEDLELISENITEFDEYEEAYGKAYYIIFNNKKQIDSFAKFFTETGYTMKNEFDRMGIYHYNHSTGIWENFIDYYNDIKETFDFIKSYSKPS